MAASQAPTAGGRAARAQTAASIAEQRRRLPDQPGVYLFRDGHGRVLYVGKAKSVRKRVASHFSKAQVPSSPGHAEMMASVEHVECVVVASEAEALLTEQSFIKQHRPRFNIRLRDDKSYPFIAISLDEAYPRVYFTRERHRPGRAYFGPYSNAKRVRGTLEVLAKVFMFRSCTGPEPGRRSGSPCLDYYIKRCGAPCVGYVSEQEYRASIDGVIDFLCGRFKTLEQELETRMRAAAAAEEFEQATLERNRLRAVHSLLERRRVANESVGTFDAVAVAVDGSEANAQVLQVRDGVLSDRQSFYLANEAERGVAEVAEEFMLQYYGGHMSIPALLVVQRALGERPALAAALASRRGGPVELRAAERGEKRRILELAERNSLLALDHQQRGDRHVTAVVLQHELLRDLPRVALGLVREVEGLSIREHTVAHLQHLRVGVGPVHGHRHGVEGTHRLVRHAPALQQRMHRPQPVALERGLLELLRGRGGEHARFELLLERLEAPAEEVDHPVDARAVLLLGDVSNARGTAALDVVVQAGTAAAASRLGAGAGAEHEHLRQHLERAPHALGVRVGAEVGAARMVALAREVHARVGLVEGDGDERIGLVVAQADVEARPVLLDEALLGQ